MTVEHVSMLLAILGGTALLAAWTAARTNDDARRDRALMFALGAGLSSASGVLYAIG